MAIYFCDPVNGNDANDALTELTPKQSVPHAQTGKNWTGLPTNPITVTSGDIVRIRKGTTWNPGPNAVDRFVPISGVTYTGYGTDYNSQLELILPVSGNPTKKYVKKVGTGMWKINGFSCGAGFQAALVGTTNRVNVVLEDMWIDGAGTDALTQIDVGNNSATSGNITFRRCRFSNAPKTSFNNLLHSSSGITGQALLMEDCLIEKAGEDLFRFNSQSNWMVGKHTFRRLSLQHPNWNTTLQQERPLTEVYGGIPGGNGDCIQVTTTPGRMEGSVLFEDLYCLKDGGGKQWMVMFDALNGWTVSNFYVDGEGTKQIAIGQLRGRACWQNGYFADTTAKTELTLFRCNPADPTNGQADGQGPIVNTALNAIYGNSGTPGTDAIYNAWLSTASVVIKNIVVAGRTGGQLFTSWEPQSSGPTYRIGCPIIVENCTSLPFDFTGVTFGSIGGSLSGGYNAQVVGAQIALWTTRVVYDGHASASAFNLIVRNNLLLKTGIAGIRQPAGLLNDARFNYQNNAFAENPTLVEDNTTIYTGIAAIQAAHNKATNNMVFSVSTNNIIPDKLTHPLVSVGTHSDYSTDIKGKQFYNPPSIGAFEYSRRRS